MSDGRLEYDKGIYWCRIVWAMQPGDLRVVAICTDDETAQRYVDTAGGEYPGFRLAFERAPVDHIFGASDLRSVVHRSAMRKYRRHP